MSRRKKKIDVRGGKLTWSSFVREGDRGEKQTRGSPKRERAAEAEKYLLRNQKCSMGGKKQRPGGKKGRQQ